MSVNVVSTILLAGVITVFIGISITIIIRNIKSGGCSCGCGSGRACDERCKNQSHSVNTVLKSGRRG